MKFGSSTRVGGFRETLTEALKHGLCDARRVTLLGSTGSIGTQAVQVIEHLARLAGTTVDVEDAPLKVAALSAGSRSLELLAQQAVRVRAELVATSGTAQDAQRLREYLDAAAAVWALAGTVRASSGENVPALRRRRIRRMWCSTALPDLSV